MPIPQALEWRKEAGVLLERHAEGKATLTNLAYCIQVIDWTLGSKMLGGPGHKRVTHNTAPRYR